MKDFESILNLINEEMTSSITNKTQKKVIEKITSFISERYVANFKH